jgi:hypothetical protein
MRESGGERALPLIMTWCPDKRAAYIWLPGDLCRDYSVGGINQHSYTVSTYTAALVFYNPKRQTRAEHRRSQAQYSVIENRSR